MVNTLEFEDAEKLETWLKDKPIEWAQAIAVRSALRVFPLVFSIVRTTGGAFQLDVKQKVILNVWRAVFVSWVASKNPTRNLMKAAAAAAAAAAVTSIGGDHFDTAGAANAAAVAAAKSTAVPGAHAYAFVAYAHTDQDWLAVSADTRFLEAGADQVNAASRLVSMPLWLEPIAESEQYLTNSPELTRQAFDSFANLDWVRNSPWELMTNWYTAVLPNDKKTKPRSLFGAITDIDIATQPDEFWEREPQIVMDAIAEIVERVASEDPNGKLDRSRFSIIRTAKDGYWDRGTIFSYDLGRFLEYTNGFYLDEFSALDDEAQTKLLNISTLFTYERGRSSRSRVGHISGIAKTGRTLDISVAFDEDPDGIDTEKLEGIKGELKIERDFELHRSHWSIKEGDLYQILHDAGLFPYPEQVTVAAFIFEYIESADAPVTIDQIRIAFRDANYRVVDKTMRGELSRLANIGDILRIDRGIYASKSWIASSGNQPPTPEAGPGPQYGNLGGKLSAVASPPTDDETTMQGRLIARLKRDIDVLKELAKPIGNSHPHLAGAIAEYGELLSANLNELDVTGLWSVGSSLTGYAQAFRDQNIARTLSEPLEPQLDGLLQSVVRQHGALILGFEEGRDLVSRADEFALDRNRLAEIGPPGNGSCPRSWCSWIS